MNNTGYRLLFNQYIARHIIAAEDETPLLTRMAKITGLQLTSKNNLPKLLLTRSFPFSDKNKLIIFDSYTNSGELIPETGWKETDFNLVKIFTHHDVPDVICGVKEKRNASCDMVILSFVYYQIYKDLLLKGGLPLHGGLIEIDNMGIILAGSSGTGKSTCCSRVQDPWNSICDDEVMIVPEAGSDYNLHPVPTWSDYFFNPDSKSSWNVEKCFTCCALFFIEQAEVDEVVPLGQGRAAVRIYQSAIESFSRYFPYIDEKEQKEISRKVFEIACDLAKDVPSFTLQTLKEGSFWQNVENEIYKLNQSYVANI